MKIEDIVDKAQKGTAAAPSSNELIETLNIKINSLTAQNKKLQDEIKQLGGGATAPGLKPIAAPSLTPSAPKIRAIDSGISKDKELELNQQINELRKQVAEKDAQLSQTSKDLIETQTQIAQIKAAGPQDSSSGNMMNLMQDLQMKIKKLKDQLRVKDEEIATLKQK
jgi:chaperonin cofactor prefoldin